ncbi:hypothetical protein AMAG_11060 [Allomyces macrogynus ATCC 38327]|uniref:VLRF1 domain-containing protein n=1 Tax=Allomyces macrogynus (strain ATCC 38327) TaxID=578462 RepID=A0A0L0SSF4_ALLM3|nr:hypothetical protein AMAG_11060 [Allomyces macrogynus ATCC 38327]|eukprot:KNE65431.1 hypothetical protein AMAG_11060 [Allomyces macrogynus ATCC 38327]
MSATNDSTTTPAVNKSPGRGKKQVADPTASGHFPSTWSLFTFPFLARITPADLKLVDGGSAAPTTDDRAVTPPGPDTLAESNSDESDQDKDGNDKDDDAAHFTCQVCAQRFADLIAQRHHFRSLWHRYNVKRVAQFGLAPVDENEFDQQYRDAERAAPAALAATAAKTAKIPVDSDSESDSENDDTDASGPVEALSVLFQRAQLEAALSGPTAASPDAALTDVRTTHTSRTYLRFQLASHPTRTFSVHRAIFPTTASPLTTSDTVLTALRTTQSAYRAVYLMIGGGHFAGAVFDRDQCIAHTSIHRYTTRRKQGGAQSSQDSKRHAKSAGANLRRYNEAALAREVWENMAKWRTHLEAANVVFVVAPGVANRRVVLGNEVAKEVFAKDDARVKSVPFTTKKPTHSEIVQIHRRLTSVQVVVPEEVEVPVAVPAVPAAAPTTVAPAPVPFPAPSEPAADTARTGKKKKKRPATTKTGTQAQAASSSSSEDDASGDDAAPAAPSGPQTLAGRPASSLVPVGLRQSLASAALSPELRLTAERERRARAAERRMGALTAANTPSMQAPAAAPAPAVEAPTGCAGCGGAIAKMPIKRHGRQFCSMKCATKFKP